MGSTSSYKPTTEIAFELLRLAGLATLAAEVTSATLADLDPISIKLGQLLEHGVEVTPEITAPLSPSRRAAAWAAREALDRLTLAG